MKPYFKIVLLGVAFCFVAMSLYAQGIKHYSLDEGLPSKRVYQIIQSTDGFIWAATDKGIAKFNGETFKIFSVRDGLPNNDIWALQETADGKIWFFTRASRLGYISNDRVFTFPFEQNQTVYPYYSTDKKDIVIHDPISRSVYRLKGNTWRETGHTKNRFYVLHPVVSFLSASDNVIELHNKDNSTKKIEITASKDVKVLPVKQINDSLVFLISKHQDLSEVYAFNLYNHHFRKLDLPTSPDFVNLLRFYDVPSGIQITGNNFYCELDKNYRIVNRKNFDRINSHWRAYKDMEGNFWIATHNDGIFMVLKKNLNARYFFSKKPVRFMAESNGYIVTSILDEGIFLYDSVKKDFKPFLNKPRRIHYFYMETPDTYAAYTDGKFTFVKKGKKIKMPEKLTYKRFYKFGDRYYFLTNFDLHIFDTLFRLQQRIKINTWDILHRFKQHIYAGSNSGLYRLEGNTPKQADEFDKPVLSLADNGKLLFIGTDGYGVFVKKENERPRHIISTGQLIVNDMYFDGNHLWLATQQGVMAYKVVSDSIRFDFTLRKYDGLISDQIINILVKNNKLFAASYSGISVSDTTRPVRNTIHKLYFDDIRYGNRRIDPWQNKIKFHKNADLSIHFNVVDFSGQEHNQYFYRLLPEQKYWKPLTNRTITLSNLHPDRYTFEVIAKNPYGQSVRNSFVFEIIPLWWQTRVARTGFFLLFVTLLLGTGYAVRRYEIKKTAKKLALQKQMAELELHALRSQMNPHFVFNSLNAIQYYISDENYNQSERYLVKFSRLIRMIFDFTRKKEIPLKNEIKLLKSYLELEKMRFGDKLEVIFKIDPRLALESQKIPTMLLQPIVENAVNHGIFHKKTPGKIVLEFTKIDTDTMQIVISDDGVGIKKAEEIKRKSLRKHLSRASEILQERIKLLNLSGKWHVTYELEDLTGDTETEFSTRVTLKIRKL